MPRRPAALAAAALVLPLAACVSQQTAGGAPGTAAAGTVSVSSTADACRLSTTQAPSGTLTFRVTNDGPDVTEFYVLGADGVRVVGEAENIGPGLSRDLVVRLEPGGYRTACKPGMVGDGIQAPFTVVGPAATAGSATTGGATAGGAAADPTAAEQLSAAQASYVAYVRTEVASLLTGTRELAEAYAGGDDATARALYAPTRVHWERIEPVAESFGDLDPLLDLREADLAAGQTWTGWHLLEKDLWPPDSVANAGTPYVRLTAAERTAAADQLVSITERLSAQVDAPEFTFEAFQIANGAKELLDEVATGKVTGEEEVWSHTDLWDLQANLEGARTAYDALAPVVRSVGPDLARLLDDRFTAVQTLMTTHGSYAAGFTPYDRLADGDVKQLAAAVDGLSEPLSRLTATVAAA